MANSQSTATEQRSVAASVKPERSPARPVRGDQAAFAALVAEHGPRVAGLARRLLGWPPEVEDVVQEVFLSAWAGLATFRGECAISTWLFRITVNACRRARRRRFLRLRFGWRRAPVAGPAEVALAQRETGARVREAVRALPARYREVVVLRYLEDLSAAEIGDVLGLERNAVDVRLSRARQRLRQVLGATMESDGHGDGPTT